MTEIKFDEKNHTAMKSNLDTIKSNLDDVVIKIEELESEFSNNFDGEAANSFITALNQLKAETDEGMGNWEKVIKSAENIATSLKEADNAAKKAIDSHSGGK